MPGFFLTLEGGEGAGKSTQGKRLAEKLRLAGHDVVLTREPGGTPQGEAVRDLLVRGDVDTWSPAAEAMLMSASRAAHVRDLIQPALTAGKVVISDRFMDSTRAYQGHAGNCDMALIEALEHAAVGHCRPHLTLIFDLDPSIGLDRARNRGAANEDRFERKGLAFHEALRRGFMQIAKAEPERCKVIAADGTPDVIFATCWREVEARFHG